ncbi:Ig heavy chain Mem5-like, partial [Scyliorhinus torazame]|uniref:Ig heavy chain Mem5-like n=1 Tax=Scyliorhinus torazame TaxID=75743 RepID=UPI003B5A4854
MEQMRNKEKDITSVGSSKDSKHFEGCKSSTLIQTLFIYFIKGINDFEHKSAQSDTVLTQTVATTGRRGETLRLTCKTSGFKLGSYYMHWLRQDPGQGPRWLVAYYRSSYKYYASDIENRFTVSKDTVNNIFALDMTDMKTEDTAIYYCAKDFSFDLWGQGTTVTVAAAITSPPTLYSLISSCQQQKTNSSVTYGCLAMDYSPEITSLTWKKDGQVITIGNKTYPSVRNKKGTYTLSSELTVIDSEVGCSKINCEVRHSGSEKSIGMQCPRKNTPPTVILTASSIKETTSSNFATIVCSISDFYPMPIAVKWLKNGQTIDSGFVT